MSPLKELTDEQINKAFHRACDEVKLTKGKLVRITEEYYEKALDLYRYHFVSDEPMHNASGVQWEDQRRDMVMVSLRQNLSIMIIDETSEEAMAFIINSAVLKEPRFSEIGSILDTSDQGRKHLLTFLHMCEQKGNPFERFNVTEAVWIRAFSTNRKYRQMGLGAQLVKATLAMIKGFGIGPVCVKIECSSAFSQRICENEGMLCLYTGNFADYVVDGRKPFSGTGMHTSLKIFGIMLQTGSS